MSDQPQRRDSLERFGPSLLTWAAWILALLIAVPLALSLLAPLLALGG